jgi:branched-chain amino acid transport system substrate-binding protein
MAEKVSRRKWLKYTAAGIVVAGVAAAGGAYYYGIQKPAREEIKIGFTIDQTSPLAAGAEAQWNSYILWSEQKNAEGGLYVKDLGKKLPIRLIFYDDKSDPATAVKYYERLITEDKVDLLVPPYGTFMHFGIVPTVEKYHMTVVGNTASGLKAKEFGAKYFFFPYPFPDKMMAAVVDLLKKYQNTVKTVSIINLQDTLLIECRSFLVPLLEQAGFNIVYLKDYPFGLTDMTAILLEAKSTNADAFIGLTYPDDAFLATQQSIQLGLNAKFFFALLGPVITGYREKFGEKTEGISSFALWSPKLATPGTKEFYEAYVKRFNKEPDYGGSSSGWATMQTMEKAIEIAGTLDNERLREVIASTEFSTVCGKEKFDGIENIYNWSTVLQWQSGINEIVAPEDRKTANLWMPKPPF